MCHRILEVLQNKCLCCVVLFACLFSIATGGLTVYICISIDIESLSTEWLALLIFVLVILILGFSIGIFIIVYICAKAQIEYRPVQVSDEMDLLRTVPRPQMHYHLPPASEVFFPVEPNSISTDNRSTLSTTETTFCEPKSERENAQSSLSAFLTEDIMGDIKETDSGFHADRNSPIYTELESVEVGTTASESDETLIPHSRSQFRSDGTFSDPEVKTFNRKTFMDSINADSNTHRRVGVSSNRELRRSKSTEPDRFHSRTRRSRHEKESSSLRELRLCINRLSALGRELPEIPILNPSDI